MKYELDGRIINIPDKDLERLQKSLNISQEEAISEKAKKNRITATVHQAKSENSAKKERKPREKKENPLKKQIIAAIFAGLCNNLDENTVIDVKNDEKYIDLSVNGLDFTINLVQHRAKK